MLDAGRALKGQFFGIQTPGPTQTTSATIIRVLNSTGVDCDRFSILGLGDPIFTPDDTSLTAFLREVTFRGNRPVFNLHNRKYCVLLDPAPKDRVVRAYIAGVCPVLVSQLDEAHMYANITVGDVRYLTSSVHGHARILWREGLQGTGYGYYDSGIQWAVVMLGVTGTCFSVAKTKTGISSRIGDTYGRGLVDLYRSEDGKEDGPIETIQVLNASADEDGYVGGIPADRYCSVAWDAEDVAWVSPLEC